MPSKFITIITTSLLSVFTLFGTVTPDLIKALGGDSNNVTLQTTILGFNFSCTSGLLWKLIFGILVGTVATVSAVRQHGNLLRKDVDLRKATFDRIFGSELQKLGGTIKIDSVLRLNIMRSYSFGFKNWFRIGYLKPVYHYGGEENRFDGALKFWYAYLGKWEYAQGICSRSLLIGQPVYGDPKKKNENFHLTKRQDKLTNDIKFIISIPVIQKTQSNAYRYIGAINIDTLDDALKDFVFSHKDYRSTIIKYFSQFSIYTGQWL